MTPHRRARSTEMGLLDVAHHLGAGPNKAIQQLSTKLSSEMEGIDGLLLLWWDETCVGLAPAAVKVSPAQGTASLSQWSRDLEPIPSEIRTATLRHLVKDQSNKRRTWLRKWSPPLSDNQENLLLEVGRSDFCTSRAISRACDQEVLLREKPTTLLKEYESSEAEPQTDEM